MLYGGLSGDSASIFNNFANFATDMGKIIVAGIGPGSKEDITPAVLDAVRAADGL